MRQTAAKIQTILFLGIGSKLVVALETFLKFKMASRFYKIGSVFSRVNGFLRKGFLKYEERPLWYDVYAQFPPKYEPKFGRPASDIEIQEIFYTEDAIRAKIHKKFSHNLGIYNLCDETEKSNSQNWIESYNEFIAQGMSESEALNQLENHGLSPVQDLFVDFNLHSETELASTDTPSVKTISNLYKILNIDFDEGGPPPIETISKSNKVDENLSEDINMDETIEVSSPVIPMAKTVSKPDDKK